MEFCLNAMLALFAIIAVRIYTNPKAGSCRGHEVLLGPRVHPICGPSSLSTFLCRIHDLTALFLQRAAQEPNLTSFPGESQPGYSGEVAAVHWLATHYPLRHARLTWKPSLGRSSLPKGWPITSYDVPFMLLTWRLTGPTDTDM